MAQAGFDFLTIDTEHSPVDVAQAHSLCQAIGAGDADCAPLVRAPGCDYATIKRFMDAGAAGVIAPLVNSAEQAREVVRAVKYPPEGERGVGFARANRYGARLVESVAEANAHSFVCVQIEHAASLRAIDEILSVPGIDAALIGPFDLSASLGVTGDFTHPKMLAAKRAILDACRRHRIAPGIHVVPPDTEEVKRAFEEGYRMIGFSLDITFLTSACRAGLGEIRESLSR